MKVNAFRMLCSPKSGFRSWPCSTISTAAAAAREAAIEVLAPPVSMPPWARPPPGPLHWVSFPPEPPPSASPTPGQLSLGATPLAPPPLWARSPVGPLPLTLSDCAAVKVRAPATAHSSETKNLRTRRIWTMLRPAACSSSSKASLRSRGTAKPASARFDSLQERPNFPRRSRKASDTAS